jgi:predicted ATPase
MIKEAKIKINGLTVIAGENDTGKSTVGKALFSIIKADNISYRLKADKQRSKEILATRLNLVFDGNITLNGKIKFLDENLQEITFAQIRDKNFVIKFESKRENTSRFFDATFVQSPLVLDLIDFFSSVSKMREKQRFDLGLDFDISYPYMMWDLYDKLSKENPYPQAKKQRQLKNKIMEIISGNFEIENGKFFYHKRITDNASIKLEMENTATGIKSFGIIQLLNENKFFTKKNLLILDEPEVHLHPKWQLKMSKVIVELVRKGVKILVNSHSPYMIEALQKYAGLYKVDANFYLAEEGYIKKINDSNSETLVKIFEKLSEPFDTFEEMDEQRMKKAING